MRAAVLVRPRQGDQSHLVWVDPLNGRALQCIPTAKSPHIGIFFGPDCALVSYCAYRSDSPNEEWLEVYRLSDWTLSARIQLDFQTHYNVRPRWPVFLPSPDGKFVYIYRALTTGHHLSEDYVSGLDLRTMDLTRWNYRIPQCVAGWAAACGSAHAQMLFIADGLETGELPVGPLDQKVSFWLGPEGGTGPMVSLGPRPRVHSDPGHARSILFAPQRPLTAVVCDDGTLHLVDPIEFHYLETQRVDMPRGHAMPPFAAQIDPRGRLLYVGTASETNRHFGAVENIVVHNIDTGMREALWTLPDAAAQVVLDDNGAFLLAVGLRTPGLWTIDATNGSTKSSMEFDGAPRFVVPGRNLNRCERVLPDQTRRSCV